MYLSSSQDILNLSLAISAFGLAFLLGWLLIYFLLIVRRVVKVLSGIERGLSSLQNFFNIIKEKLESSTSYLSVLALGAKELIGYFAKQQGRGKKK